MLVEHVVRVFQSNCRAFNKEWEHNQVITVGRLAERLQTRETCKFRQGKRQAPQDWTGEQLIGAQRNNNWGT